MTSQVNNKEKQKPENELNVIYEKKYKGHALHYRANWIKHGEKVKLEQNRQQNNVIGKIDNGDKTVYNNNKIIEELCNLKSIYIFTILKSHQN